MIKIRVAYIHENKKRRLPMANFKRHEDMWQYVGAMEKFLGEAFRGFVMVKQGNQV